MNQSTHPIVDPILAVLAMLMVLALAMAGGCAVIPPGHPVAAYSLISIDFQLGGSRTEAVVDVANTQDGDGNTIEKRNPLSTSTDAGTELNLKGVP